MKSLFGKSKRAHVARNAFDMSQRQLFTAPAGMLLPCYVQEVLPDENWRINVESFLRTQPLNSAAYARYKQNIEFFYVPMELLYTHFNQFIVGTDHAKSNYYPTGKALNSLSPISFTTHSLMSLFGSIKSKGTKDMFGYPLIDGSMRLLSLLGYGDFVGYESSPLATPNVACLPFRLLAYQKIVADHFINSDYYTPNASLWNLDDIVSGSNSLGLKFQAGEGAQFITPRYALWKRNYFTALHPSFQSASFLTNFVNIPPLAITGGFIDSDGYATTADPAFVGTTTSTNTNPEFSKTRVGALTSFRGVDTDIPTTLTAPSLRSMLALDKFYRTTIEAANGSYAAQLAAHFGIEVPHDPTISTRIGSMDAPISIDEVVTTANTQTSSGGSPAADIFGRGASLNNGRTIEFNTPKHGIIMGIFYVTPEVDMAAQGLDKNNTLLSFADWPQEEFMDLGFQPVASYEYKLFDSISAPSVLGWTNRYANFKTSVDKVHYPFSPNGSLNAWASTFQASQPLWQSGVTDSFLHVNPSITNTISQVAYDGTRDTDFLLCNILIHATSLRNMSVSGQPS